MKTIEELKTRIQELRQKASEAYLTNQEQAKQFRQQAREASKRCQVLIQELKR